MAASYSQIDEYTEADFDRLAPFLGLGAMKVWLKIQSRKLQKQEEPLDEPEKNSEEFRKLQKQEEPLDEPEKIFEEFVQNSGSASSSATPGRQQPACKLKRQNAQFFDWVDSPPKQKRFKGNLAYAKNYDRAAA